MQKQNTWLPPEWHPQSAIILAWPDTKTSWLPWLDSVQSTYCKIIQAISESQYVLLICRTQETVEHVKKQLDFNGINQNHMIYSVTPYDDTWVRDYGPITVLSNGIPTLLNFQFNGWGGKYPADFDDALNHTLYQQKIFSGHKLDSFSLILEGGAIDTDGHGALLTTRSCLLQRNHTITEQNLNSILQELFGIEKVLWLNHGRLVGDDTGGHIDTLARFCNANTICYTKCYEKNDEHYSDLLKMEQELHSMQDAQGRAYQLIPLPLPQAKYNNNGERLPATYANFLIANHKVLVPLYNDENDAIALKQIGRAFPNHCITGINCLPLIEQFGSLHCSTMQLPREVNVTANR